MDVERHMLRLPCGHLADTPTRSQATIDCGACPRRFELTRAEGGRVWNSREVAMTGEDAR